MNPVSKLKQKLTNLVSNAVSKVESGAIRIRKELPNIINLLYKVKINHTPEGLLLCSLNTLLFNVAGVSMFLLPCGCDAS